MIEEVKKGYSRNDAVYFIETLPDSGAYEFNGTVIAFTPEAIYELSKRRIHFLTLAEFFSLESALAYEASYSKILHEWIDLLDNKLLEKLNILKSLKIRPALLYGYYLQLLIDTFVIKALEIKSVLDKLNPVEVVLFNYEEKEQPVDYQLAVKGCDTISIVLPFLCQKYNIPFRQHRILKGQDHCQKLDYPALLRQVIRKITQNILLFSRWLKGFSKRQAVLIVRGGWGVDEIEISAMKNGYRCLRSIKKYRWLNKEDRSLLKLSDLDIDTKVFDDFVGVNFSQLFNNRLRFFVEYICPNLESAVLYYLRVFDRRNIKCVVTPQKFDFDDFPLMAAATVSKKVLAVQVHHGYSASDVRLWKFTEQPCNLWITLNPELKEYFLKSIFNKSATQVELSGLWTNRYRKAAKTQPKEDARKTVLYVPTEIGLSWKRLDGISYFDTWYFEYQLELLRYFSSEKYFYFIYKAFPISNKASSTLKRIIKDSRWDNVIYSDGDLYGNMLKADYAVIDMPSTPLYEAALAGLPAICLYHEGFRLRDSAKDFFGRVLQPFSTIEDAVEKIRNFLRGDPKGYVRDIKTHDGNAFEIIQRHIKDRTAEN